VLTTHILITAFETRERSEWMVARRGKRREAGERESGERRRGTFNLTKLRLRPCSYSEPTFLTITPSPPSVIIAAIDRFKCVLFLHNALAAATWFKNVINKISNCMVK
jgi:hypothetical protein